ncbi:MAG: response regulator [Kangiellaceae bacterium]|jgi:CheY-like chemotaxis protein/hemerythrin|nr:response regulator [Kangiellaceae bacterium]
MAKAYEHEYKRTPLSIINSALVVDDSKLFCNAISKMLRLIGIIDIEQSHSGKNAIDRLKQRSFDLVISDINMAPVSGIELLKAVRCGLFGIDRAQAFMVLSSKLTPQVVRASIELDLDYIMPKPPIKNALKSAIDICQRRLLPLRAQSYYADVSLEGLGLPIAIKEDSFASGAGDDISIDEVSKPRMSAPVKQTLEFLRKEQAHYQALFDEISSYQDESKLLSKLDYYIEKLVAISIEHFNEEKPYILQYDERATDHITEHEVIIEMLRNLQLSHRAFKLDSSEEFVEILETMLFDHNKRFDDPLYQAMDQQSQSLDKSA